MVWDGCVSASSTVGNPIILYLSVAMFHRAVMVYILNLLLEHSF